MSTIASGNVASGTNTAIDFNQWLYSLFGNWFFLILLALVIALGANVLWAKIYKKKSVLDYWFSTHV